MLPLERLVLEMQKGMTRHIGVSNFTPNMMRRAYERGRRENHQQSGGVPPLA